MLSEENQEKDNTGIPCSYVAYKEINREKTMLTGNKPQDTANATEI